MSKIQKVEYRYGDSSVPPRHHRSYSITIERKAIGVVVNSYGEVLIAQSFILAGNEFEEVKKMIKKAKGW